MVASPSYFLEAIRGEKFLHTNHEILEILIHDEICLFKPHEYMLHADADLTFIMQQLHKNQFGE